MERKQITFDSFIRSIMAIIIFIGIILLLKRLSSVLLPFFLAWLIAYLLFPLVKFFQYRCRLHFRILGILCAFLVTGAILFAAFWLIIPPMVEESLRVKDLVIHYVTHNETMSNIPSLIQEYIHQNFSERDVRAFITGDGFMNAIKESVPKIWTIITQSFSAVNSLLSATMVFLYTLFILIDYERLTGAWAGMVPDRYRSFAVQLVHDVEDGMNKYFRGQACVAFSVGLLFSIGFSIIGFPMAVGLGMFIGILNMVPYLQIVGLVPTVLLAIVKAADSGENFWFILLTALIVFAVVQIIQDTILTPRIMGKVMGLNSAIILLSLSVWGSLLGMLGMIIALPMTTLLITYYQKYIIKRQS